MEQRSRDAAVKDARIMPDVVEYARGMEQRSSFAAVKDAQTLSSEEECV